MKSIVGVWLAYAFLLLSCTFSDRDFQIKGVKANPTLALPLAFGDLSIMDLIKKSDSAQIKVKSDGLVYLSYDQALLSKDIRNLVNIPNVGNTITQLPVPPGTYPANPNDVVSTSISNPIDLGISPEKLNEIGFKSGTLTYNAVLSPANPNFKYAVRIAIPEFISSNGSSFLQEVSGSGSISLVGYTFKSAVANKFTLQLTLIIKQNTTPVTIPAGTNLNTTISFAGIDFNYIEGFFGNQIANPPAQIIDIGAFGTSFENGATVSFAKPVFNINVVSDYGVPLAVSFSKLEARKHDGTSIQVQTNPASPIAITAPTTLGTSATTPVTVTNVAQLVNFAPDQFYYQVSGHINAGFASGKNFMADTSQMRVKLHIEIPMYGQASNIVLADTMDIDLGDVDQTTIDSASLKVFVTNQLPLDAKMQFILTDAKYHFIDSLLTSSQTKIVVGSTVDSNGELQSPGVVDTSYPLVNDKISKIFKAKKLIVKSKLQTSRNSSGSPVDVQFKSQYKIKLNLGLRVTFKLSDNL
ncbi:MAG TPA: hypothetical protein VGQ59_06840 [Cyclobacteriaceae bacterium]|jgi:hypothetical protein|nr:hypothetical protein [Cyclobacteriaceae bacterium]